MVRISPSRFLLTFLLLVFTAGMVQAQRPGAPEWRTERERLKRLIETAREVMTAYPNDQAQGLLAKAEALTREIDQQIAGQNYAHALSLIRETIAIVENALKLALNSPFQRLYTRLQELLQRAESEVLGSGNREAVRLVQEARKNKLQGDQAGRGHPFQAIQYFQVAINLLENALKLIGSNPSGNGSPVDLANRAREYYQDLETQLQERLPACTSPAARRLYEQSRRLLQLAEEAFRKGDYALAQRFYNNAVRLLLRALDLCPVQNQSPAQFQAAAASLRDMITTAEEQLHVTNDPRDRALLDWARKMMLDAEAARLAQKPQEASRSLERARRLVERVLRNRSPKPIDHQEQCEAALQQLRTDIAEMEAEAKDSDRAEARSFLELAQKAAAEAEKICLRKPHTLLSLATFRAMVRLGHQLLLQRETFLQDAQPGKQERAAVQQKLQQLEATMSEVHTNLTANPNGYAQSLFDQAVTLRARAQMAFQNGQYYLSAELCNLAFELLRETLKLGTE